MTPIDVVNKSILICVFLIGFLSGSVLTYIVNCINESLKKRIDE